MFMTSMGAFYNINKYFIAIKSDLCIIISAAPLVKWYYASMVRMNRWSDSARGHHNRIHTLIQSGICEKPQKCSEMGIFSYLLVAYRLIYLIFRAYFLSGFLPITHTLDLLHIRIIYRKKRSIAI